MYLYLSEFLSQIHFHPQDLWSINFTVHYRTYGQKCLQFLSSKSAIMKKGESSFSIHLLHVISKYHVFIVISLIGWGVLVYAVFPCRLSCSFVLVRGLCSFPQPTVLIRKWSESKLHVWQCSTLFKIMPNMLVIFWLVLSWYFLTAIYYNSKISFLSDSSLFTVHHYGLAGIFFFFLSYALLSDVEFYLRFLADFFFWYKKSSLMALSQLLFLALRLLSSYPIPFLDHLWIQ